MEDKHNSATDDQSEVVGVAGDVEETDESRALSGKYYKQTYRQAWEQLPDFKGWLKGVEGEPTRAFCTYCRVTLFAHRLSLLKHTCTMKHAKAAQKNFINENFADCTSQVDILEDVIPIQAVEEEQNVCAMETKLNLRPLKKPPSSGVTVTIIQEGSEEKLKLHMDDSLTRCTGAAEEPQEDGVGGSYSSPPVLVEIHESEDPLPCNADQAKKAAPKKLRIIDSNMQHPLSTHVLDTSKGQAVGGIQVSLYRLVEGRWTFVNEGVTTEDGRCGHLIQRCDFVAGRYKLHFDTDKYFELERKESLYPFIEIVFDVHAPQEHYHIPLLLSPFGYTTYRGS